MKQASEINYINSQHENEQLFKTEYDLAIHAFFNNSGSILVLFNRNLEITAFNAKAQIYANELFNSDFVIGKKVFEILPETFQSSFIDLSLKALDGIESSNIEINLPETTLWWNLRYSPLYNNSKEIFGASFTAIDISEKKKSEELLIKSEARFKSLNENGSDMISMYDQNFKTIFRSEAAFELTGRIPDEVENDTSILQYLHPDDFIRLQPTLEKLLSSKGIKIHETFRWRHKDGTYRWLEGNITNLLHDENIKAIVTNMRDITDDMKLREGQSLLASIVNSTDDAVISTRLDGKITSWNKSAEKLLGFKEEEVMGDDFKLFIPTDIYLSESILIDKARKGAYFNQIQSKRVKKNGEIIDVSLTMSPIRNENNEVIGVSKIIRDVTHFNKTKRERELLIKELSSNNKELKQFSYITAHNLRGPLTNLMGIIKLLNIDTITDVKTKTLVEAFISSTNSLNETLDDLIKILIVKENNNNELASLNFEEHLLKVINSISNTIEISQTDIDYDFKAANTVSFNSAYLESIFLNLITNAIKYSRPHVKPQISISSSIENNCVHLSFTDNGLGMDWNKVKDKIFGLYQKFHRHPDSKGIGLYLVHSQITALGGSIEVKTEPNKGTTFIISFAPELINPHSADFII